MINSYDDFTLWDSRQYFGDYTLSESTVQIMKVWIQNCLNSHNACILPILGVSPPRRLIDVGPKDGSRELFLLEVGETLPNQILELPLELLVEGDNREYSKKEEASIILRYATLSHCWGGTQHLQSTIGTLDQRKKLIPLSSMNQTFRDAVNITRSLGLQYLWIDSLCIIQDSHSDWLQESGKMCSVYSNAVVNIAATSSSNGDESFLHSRPRAIALPNMCGRGEDKRPSTKTIYIRPAIEHVNSFKEGTLSTRAWCYQEEILSPRTISFGHAQVGFECRKLRCRENDPSSSDVPSSFDKNERFRFSSLLAPSSSTERDDLIKLWHSMVGSYSKRKLSFTKDKLPAISGLAMQIGSFLKDHYLAGLWRSDLPYGLCWSAENVDSSFKATPYTAPTWSWASQTGGVRYDWFYSLSKYKIDWDVKVLDCSTECISNDIYGQVKGGYIKLEGRIVEIRIDRGQGRDSLRQFILRKGDVSFCHRFDADEWDLTTEDKVFWCMLHGSRDSDSIQEQPLLLILKQIDDSTEFERVGFADYCGYWSRKTLNFFDGVHRRQIILL